MNIEFDSAALEELYTNGATQDHQYKRLPKDIIKRYIKVVKQSVTISARQYHLLSLCAIVTSCRNWFAYLAGRVYSSAYYRGSFRYMYIRCLLQE